MRTARATEDRALWRHLQRTAYREAITSGALRCGLYLDESSDWSRPTVIFIHGAGGTPSRFASLADALRDRVNCGIFVWDDTARLAPSAELLRAQLEHQPGRLGLVAHSMGALLVAHLGATDHEGRFANLAALYLNPLIGGSRYAGDFRFLRWLGVGKLLTRAFFPPSVLDLAPESEFQQSICGPAGAASSFAARTVLLFTEQEGQEPDVPASRIPYYFGCTREKLLTRFGTRVDVRTTGARGHNGPLIEPSVAVPLLEELLIPAHNKRRPRSGNEASPLQLFPSP